MRCLRRDVDSGDGGSLDHGVIVVLYSGFEEVQPVGI